MGKREKRDNHAGPSNIYRIACSAIIERGGAYLLARRRDIGWWNLPGGGLEEGETVEEGLLREVREEIGVDVRIVRLVGVYSKPQKNEVVLTFLCKLTDETPPSTSEEISEIAWFQADELPAGTLPKHRQRVLDAALDQSEAILRAQTTSTAVDQRLPNED